MEEETNSTSNFRRSWANAETHHTNNDTKNHSHRRTISTDDKRKGRFSTIAKKILSSSGLTSDSDDEDDRHSLERPNSFLSAHRLSTSTSALPNENGSWRKERAHTIHVNTAESFSDFESSKRNKSASKRIQSHGTSRWRLDDEKSKEDKYFKKWMKKLHKGDIEKKARQGFLTEDEVETLFEIALGTLHFTDNSTQEELKRLACFALAGAAFPVETVAGCRRKLISNGLLEPFLQYALDNVRDDNETEDTSIQALTVHNEIKESEIEIIKSLAQGASAKVYLGKYKGKEVAVKMFDKDHISFSLKEFKRELFILSVLQNDHFVRCYGGGGAQNRPFIVSEFMSKGPLSTFLQENYDFMDLKMMLKIAKDISAAMKWLHSVQIIHRDLKSMNVLMNDEMECKIIDFGASRMIDACKTMTGNLGTAQWIAPELFRAERYTEKADVYSFGIVMWEILSGKIPFNEVSQSWKIPELVVAGNRPVMEGVELPPGSELYVELMKLCWDDDPSKRPSFEELHFAFGCMLTNLNEDGSYANPLTLEKLLTPETVFFY